MDVDTLPHPPALAPAPVATSPTVHRKADPLAGQVLADGLRVSAPSDPLEREAEATSPAGMRKAYRMSPEQDSKTYSEEVIERINALVNRRGGLDNAFRYYARADRDDLVSRSELMHLLADARIARFQRVFVANEILSRVDRNGDGKISLEELRNALNSRRRPAAR